MPLKKKKKSGKKKGGLGGKGKKKKKSAKKKLTKTERAALKLDKAVDEFIGDLDRYNNFIARMDKWILENSKKIIELFRSYDVDTITYDEFKAGMFDLDAPCNNLELHIIALRVDRRKTGNIDYLELSKGLRFYREDEEEEGDDEGEGLEDELEEVEEDDKEEEEIDEQAAADKAKDLILFGKKAEEETEEQEDEEPTEEIKLTITKEDIEHCPCCKVGLWKPYKNRAPKYVVLHLRLVTFDKVRSYPGHLTKLVHSHLTIYGVMQIIFEEAAILTSKLKVFIDKSRSVEALLRPSVTLEDCGFEGGVYQDPEKAILYYDYQTEFNDCPILMSDYYFV